MIFEEVKMECGYRADIVVEKSVVVDTKTIAIEKNQTPLTTKANYTNKHVVIFVSFVLLASK